MLHTNYARFTNCRIIKLVTKNDVTWRHTRSSSQRSSTDICLAKADRRRRRSNVKGKRTIYEIKALRHCDLHRPFGQKLHHNWEGRKESFATLLLTTRFEHLMFARMAKLLQNSRNIFCAPSLLLYKVNSSKWTFLQTYFLGNEAKTCANVRASHK